MNELKEVYKNLPDYEKDIFKELLNDIIYNYNQIQLNKYKSSITYYTNNINGVKNHIENKFRKNLKQNFSKLSVEKCKEIENIYNEEIKNINKIIFGGKFKDLIFLEIYKGNFNEKNNSLFIKRRDFIDLLVSKNLIHISEFNISKEFIKYKNGEFDEELKFISDLISEQINNFKLKYGKDIIEKEEEILLNGEKKFEYIAFNINEIKRLVRQIEVIENLNLFFENGILYFKGLEYKIKENSNRFLLLELFFSDKNKKEYRIKEILLYLQNGSVDFGNKKKLDEQIKGIYDLYRKFNKDIEKKLKIKNLFEVVKGDYESKIKINM